MIAIVVPAISPTAATAAIHAHSTRSRSSSSSVDRDSTITPAAGLSVSARTPVTTTIWPLVSVDTEPPVRRAAAMAAALTGRSCAVAPPTPATSRPAGS